MLFDMIKDAEQKAGVAAPPPEPRRLDEADQKVVRGFVERIREDILAEMAAEKTDTPEDEQT
jgi:hypothetical protein